MTSSPAISPIASPESLPLRGADVVHEFGAVLVVAPHPDDETLGCGGLMALLSDRDIPVRVLVISDGAGSHRRSKKYPPGRLRALRERETIDALGRLSSRSIDVTFLGLPDQHVPGAGSAGFDRAVRRCAAAIGAGPHVASTVVVPWRRDPHCDHRASWQIVRGALDIVGARPRMLEYPVWVTEFGEPADYPRPGEMHAWRLDIGAALQRKIAATAMHRSQTTDLIDDDPTGFRLSAETLRRFARPWEVFLEEPYD
jgi:LmbE family N-acetylglucosaminyl deacetylase